jgi:hypothetical protein
MEPNDRKQGLDPDTADPKDYDPNGWGGHLEDEQEQAPEPPKRGGITRSGWITLQVEDDF